MEFSFRYVQDYNGISTEESYPYTAKQGPCSRGKRVDMKVVGYASIGFSENQLKEAVGKLKVVNSK